MENIKTQILNNNNYIAPRDGVSVTSFDNNISIFSEAKVKQVPDLPPADVLIDSMVKKPKAKRKDKEYIETQKYILTELKEKGQNAKTMLTATEKKDGWAGDLADAIAVVKNNDLLDYKHEGNRYEYNQEAIAKHEQNVKTLETAFKKGDFEEKFQEIYGKSYDANNVLNYKTTKQTYEKATKNIATEEFIKNKLGNSVEKFKLNNGEYKTCKQIQTVHTFEEDVEVEFIIPPEQITQGLEQGLSELLGGSENLQKVIKQSGVDYEKLTPEQKYKYCGEFASKFVETSEKNTKESLGNKSYKDIKNEYKTAQDKVFGKESIDNRVKRYADSQEIGSAVVKGVAEVALFSAVTLATGGAGGILMSSVYTGAASIVVSASDKMTNDLEDLDKEAWGKIIETGAIEGAKGALNPTAVRKAMEFINITNKAVENTAKIATKTLTSTGIDVTAELVKNGSISSEQVGVKLLLNATFGNIKSANTFTNTSLKLTKKGIDKAKMESIKIDNEEQVEDSKYSDYNNMNKWLNENSDEFYITPQDY